MAYNTYRHLPDDGAPDDGPTNPDSSIRSDSDQVSVLYDEWNVSDLNDAAADRADILKLLEPIRSYYEAASESRPRSVKDIP